MHLRLSDFEPYITPLITAAEIAQRCGELAAQIDADYAGCDLVTIGILKGVYPFYWDLTRRMALPIRNDFLGLSSYGSRSKTSGVVRLTSDLSNPVNGKDVLIIEDIVDTGLTMNYLLESLKTRGPRSVKICTLLHKPDNGRIQVPLDYIGFTIENHFVVGYGLDYKERLRNLPYIGYFAGEVPEMEE